MRLDTLAILRPSRPRVHPHALPEGMNIAEAAEAHTGSFRDVKMGLFTPTFLPGNSCGFCLFRQGEEIVVVLRIEAEHVGAGDSLEVAFCPGDDGLTRWHYTISADGHVGEYPYCPTELVHSTRYETSPPFSFTGERVGDFKLFILRMAAGPLFRDTGRCGFHVGSSLGGRYLSWSYCSGNGGQDASSYGLLLEDRPRVSVEVEAAVLAGRSLKISGSSSAAGRGGQPIVQAKDPFGAPLSVRFTSSVGGWEICADLSPIYCGRHHFQLTFPSASPLDFAVDVLSPAGRDEGFCLSVTNDPPVTMRRRGYGDREFKEEAEMLRVNGFHRLHWIDQAPLSTVQTGTTVPGSQDSGGRLLQGMTKACHDAGLEIFGDLKIFDMGANVFMADQQAENTICDLDGRWYRCSADIVRRQDLTMGLPDGTPTEALHPIVRLVIFSEAPLILPNAEDVCIRLSANNRDYEVYAGPRRIRQYSIEREHFRWTPAGDIPEPGRQTNWCVELGDLNLDQPYCEIDFGSSAGTALHRGFALVEAWDASGRRAPLTQATQGTRDLARGQGHFFWKERCRWFNATEPLFEKRRWSLSPLAMAFRLSPRLPTLLDVLDPESHEIWLGWIDDLLAAGVDGVSIRTLCHHNGVESYAKYAWGRAARRRAGHPITPQVTLARAKDLQIWRGEAFQAFLEKASHRVRGAGRKFALQIECGFELTAAQQCRMQMAVDVPAILEANLLDEVALKWLTSQNPWVHRSVLPLARRQGTPVHVISRNLDRLEGLDAPRTLTAACQDAAAAGLAGFNFYEWFNITRCDEGQQLTLRPEMAAALADPRIRQLLPLGPRRSR